MLFVNEIDLVTAEKVICCDGGVLAYIWDVQRTHTLLTLDVIVGTTLRGHV